MKFFKYILLFLSLSLFSQPGKLIKRTTQNNCLAQPVGVLVYNDFNSASWTYSGTGTAPTFTPGVGITMTGGTSSIASNLMYTYMPTNLNSSTTTVRVTMSNTDASNGVVGLGVVSRNAAALRHFVIINCRTGATKGNMLLFYDNAFDSETDPSFIPFTTGDQIEIQYIQTLFTITFKVRNVTQVSSVITKAKTLSITYLTGALDIPDIVNLTVFNYSGTNRIDYFKYESDEKQYADLLLVGDSKTQGFYSATQAQRYGEVYATASKKTTVNVAAQSNKLEQYVLLNNLIYKMKPKAVLMCAAFRNNISATTFDATAKANYLSITQNAERIGSVVYHLKPLPEAVLDQSTGLTYITTTYPVNKILDITNTFVSGTHNADGTHPNVAGNALLGANANTVIPKYYYKR